MIASTAASGEPDIATVLMRSTFKLSGQGSVGTGFIIGRPIPEKEKEAALVLVTAAHVLEAMRGDHMTIHFRKFVDGKYSALPTNWKIRVAGQPIWKKHPHADIAAMPVAVSLDVDLSIASTDTFATDDSISKYEVNPGDDLFALGYPLGEAANTAGFSILRSGTIASYPITPTKETKSLLFDFEVYKGNSGGPVFLRTDTRFMNGRLRAGPFQMLVGLVSSERLVHEQVNGLLDTTIKTHRLKLAEVIHASLILETIEML